MRVVDGRVVPGEVVRRQVRERRQQRDEVEPREVRQRAGPAAARRSRSARPACPRRSGCRRRRAGSSPRRSARRRRARRASSAAAMARAGALGAQAAGRHGALRRRPTPPAARSIASTPRVADGGAAVLVVQVEAELGLVPVAQAFSRRALRRRQVERVAVDVDRLRVAALVALGAVRVQHRDHRAASGRSRMRPRTGLVRVREQVVGRRRAAPASPTARRRASATRAAPSRGPRPSVSSWIGRPSTDWPISSSARRPRVARLAARAAAPGAPRAAGRARPSARSAPAATPPTAPRGPGHPLRRPWNSREQRWRSCVACAAESTKRGPRPLLDKLGVSPEALADARDSKSRDSQGSCGFDPTSGAESGLTHRATFRRRQPSKERRSRP